MSPLTTLKSTSDQTSAEYLAGRVKEAYQLLDAGDVSLVETLYADDVYFEDPSHGIQGKSGLVSYFESMFSGLDSCKFKFHRTLTSDTEVFLSWTMLVNKPKVNNGETIRVEGTSYLKTRNGKIYYHRDYFDMGALVYEHMPIIGWFVKKARLNFAK